MSILFYILYYSMDHLNIKAKENNVKMQNKNNISNDHKHWPYSLHANYNFLFWGESWFEHFHKRNRALSSHGHKMQSTYDLQILLTSDRWESEERKIQNEYVVVTRGIEQESVQVRLTSPEGPVPCSDSLSGTCRWACHSQPDTWTSPTEWRDPVTTDGDGEKEKTKRDR